jgi:hypothetical protein
VAAGTRGSSASSSQRARPAGDLEHVLDEPALVVHADILGDLERIRARLVRSGARSSSKGCSVAAVLVRRQLLPMQVDVCSAIVVADVTFLFFSIRLDQRQIAGR